MSRIDNYNKSAGLRNHYVAYVISVSVKKEHIKGSLQDHKASAYSNFVEWSDVVRMPGAQMILIYPYKRPSDHHRKPTLHEKGCVHV
jgi:hypothetical protein